MELVFGKLIFLEAAAKVLECAGLRRRQGKRYGLCSSSCFMNSVDVCALLA